MSSSEITDFTLSEAADVLRQQQIYNGEVPRKFEVVYAGNSIAHVSLFERSSCFRLLRIAMKNGVNQKGGKLTSKDIGKPTEKDK